MDGVADFEVYPRINDAYQEGKSLMQRESKVLGNLSPGGPEDTRFRSFFGAGATTILVAWHAMAEHNLLPNNLLFIHYLWALLFMCVYPKNEKAFCALVGGPDRKTVRKKTWPFIFALYELNYFVVRFCLLILYSCLEKSNCRRNRSCLKIGRLATPSTTR
jgi:hypothetical protein